MKLRFAGLSAAVAAAVIVPSLGSGQGTGSSPGQVAVAERVVVAEVRESQCMDGTRSVRVKLLDAGQQPSEVRVVDAQGYVHTYVLSAQLKR